MFLDEEPLIGRKSEDGSEGVNVYNLRPVSKVIYTKTVIVVSRISVSKNLLGV